MKTGNLVLIAALGMMATLMSEEIRQLTNWSEVLRPAFIGTLFAHFGAVIGAYIAGRFTPDNRNGKYTRVSDTSLREIPRIDIDGI